MTITAVGLQPAEVLMRHGLSTVVTAGIPSLIGHAKAILEEWGHTAHEHSAAAHA
jgi:hypothetical protein